MSEHEAQYSVSDTELNEGLRKITRALEAAGAASVGGGLGGEDGYGCMFANEVFGMHPYCWCELEECAWCSPCSCPDDANEYLVNGEVVSYEEFCTVEREGNVLSIVQVASKACEWCRGTRPEAPNFWHARTRSWVSWYKYIGRSMEHEIHAPWATIVQECIKSIPSKIKEDQTGMFTTTPEAPTFGPLFVR